MDINWIITRVKSLLLTPREAWPEIAAEPETVKGLYTRYILVVAALPVIAGFLKSSLLGYDLLGVTVRLGFWAALGNALLQYGLSLGVVYVIAQIVNALAPAFGGEKDLTRSLQVVAYAWTGAWAGATLVILPWLGWLFSLAGAGYSIYLLRMGLPHTQKCPDASATRYAGTVAVLAVILSILLGSLFYFGSHRGQPGSGAPDLTLTSPDGKVTIDADRAMKQLEALAEQMQAAGGQPGGSGQSASAEKQAQAIIGQQLKSMQEQEAAKFPCRLFPQAELEALLGNPLDMGSYAFNNVSENDHAYKSESCAWSAAQGQGSEVALWVSLPQHFASGQVECAPGAGQAIAGIGDQAWWDFKKYFGMGTLRVCATQAMLEVKVTVAGKDEALARKVAETMAGKVLEVR
jgi:Yip1 domain